MIDWNKPIETVRGEPARVLGTVKHRASVVVAIQRTGTNHEEDVEDVWQLKDDGTEAITRTAVIRNKQEGTFEGVVYANIYEAAGATGTILHATRELADRAADTSNRLACVKVKVEGKVGQFDD